MKHGDIRGAWLIGVWLGILLACPAAASAESMMTRERAQQLLAAGVISEAATVLTHYLDRQADDVAARYKLARLLVDQERYTDAVEHALLIPADHMAYGVARQHLLLRIRMRMASDLDWEDPDEVLEYARVCSRMGSYERSARIYLRLLEETAKPEWRREYAAVLSWGGSMPDAAREWKRYLESQPDDLEGWHQLARAEMALGNLEEAQRRLQEILERQPHHRDVMMDSVRVKIWMGDTESANRILAQLQEMNYKPVDVGILRSELLLRFDQVEAAYDSLQNVYEVAPDDQRVQQMLHSLETSRRVEIARLRRRISESPEDEADRSRLIDILLDIDRPGAALREMKALALLRPGDPFVQERIAQLEARQQRDIARMMDRLTKTSGSEHDLETRKDWLARHPDDLRAVGYLDRSFLPTYATEAETQP